MKDDETRLDVLAALVSDDRPVDWDSAETAALDEGERAQVRALRDASRIAEFSRALQRSPQPGIDFPASQEPGRWGDLLLLECVGAGASGEVWRAWDGRLQRDVALKFLSAGAPIAGGGPNSALLDEARALARVRHPGVVAVHGIDERDGRVGMWMEFLHGTTLDAEIERRGAMPPAEVRRIGGELCRALGAVHAAGLVHRDVKPANILLEAGGRVVLTDFGLGRRRIDADSDSRRISGTPLFMSPERLAGESSTPRSDLYSLGVTLRCALTGRAPFSAQTLDELQAQAKAGPVTPLSRECPAAPAALVAAIERAMAPEPGNRFAGAAEMESALEAGLVPEVTAAPRRNSWASRLLLAAAAALALAGLSRLLLKPAPPAPSARRQGVAVAPAGPVAYDVEASLVRRTGGAYRRLGEGDRVAPGDRLGLEFRATQRAYVYVLNEDERGEHYLLYPQPLFDRTNPIPADSTVLLPGSVGGRENAWVVTSRGGREHFLVVANREPVPEIETELRKLPAASPGHPVLYARIGAQTLERLRGVGGVAAVPEDRAPHRAGTFDRFEALAGREQGVHGVWVRQITLENPTR